jgi:hypothetical protein
MRKKNRIHSVSLNSQAEMIWRKVKKVLPRGYLSNMVSQLIIGRFGKDDLRQKLAREMIKSLERDKIRVINKIGRKQAKWLEILKQ